MLLGSIYQKNLSEFDLIEPTPSIAPTKPQTGNRQNSSWRMLCQVEFADLLWCAFTTFHWLSFFVSSAPHRCTPHLYLRSSPLCSALFRTSQLLPDPFLLVLHISATLLSFLSPLFLTILPRRSTSASHLSNMSPMAFVNALPVTRSATYVLGLATAFPANISIHFTNMSLSFSIFSILQCRRFHFLRHPNSHLSHPCPDRRSAYVR